MFFCSSNILIRNLVVIALWKNIFHSSFKNSPIYVNENCIDAPKNATESSNGRECVKDIVWAHDHSLGLGIEFEKNLDGLIISESACKFQVGDGRNQLYRLYYKICSRVGSRVSYPHIIRKKKIERSKCYQIAMP